MSHVRFLPPPTTWVALDAAPPPLHLSADEIAKGWTEALHPRDSRGRFIAVLNDLFGDLHYDFGNLGDPNGDPTDEERAFMTGVGHAAKRIREKFPQLQGSDFEGFYPVSSMPEGPTRERLRGAGGFEWMMATASGSRVGHKIYMNDEDNVPHLLDPYLPQAVEGHPAIDLSRGFKDLPAEDMPAGGDGHFTRLTPAGRDGEGSATHELGHVLANIAGLTDTEIADALVKSGWMTELPRTHGKRTFHSAKLLQISTYATTSMGEAHAELFNLLNRPDPWDDTDVPESTRQEVMARAEAYRKAINARNDYTPGDQSDNDLAAFLGHPPSTDPVI